jgi:hypothetical protein
LTRTSTSDKCASSRPVQPPLHALPRTPLVLGDGHLFVFLVAPGIDYSIFPQCPDP